MADMKIADGVYARYTEFSGWRIIYPYKNSDGSFNWFNFFTGGSWGKLLMTSLIVALILFMTFSYYDGINQCVDLQNNICDYLPNITNYCFNSDLIYQGPILDLDNITLP